MQSIILSYDRAVMPLDLGRLRAFEAVGRTGSFSRAAAELSVTQPAVSVQVRQLEQHVGVPLFDRVRRRPRLTQPGQTLFQYVQRIFALAREADEALSLARGLRAGRLQVVASLTAAAYYLPPVLAAFQRQHPGIRVQLSVDNSRRVAQRVLALTDDLGVLSGEPRDPSLALEPFCEDPVVLIVPPAHPWARRRAVSLRELRGEPLILREPGSATRAFIEDRMAAAGVDLHVTMELGSNEAIKRTVETGNGLTLISAAVVHREVAAGYLALVRIRERGFVRRYYLGYHRERRESPLIRAVLEVAREAFRRAGAPGAPGRLDGR
jgi:aminoethylphosphonate catabolism LysR family transcriptional regulator